ARFRNSSHPRGKVGRTCSTIDEERVPCAGIVLPKVIETGPDCGRVVEHQTGLLTGINTIDRDAPSEVIDASWECHRQSRCDDGAAARCQGERSASIKFCSRRVAARTEGGSIVQAQDQLAGFITIGVTAEKSFKAEIGDRSITASQKNLVTKFNAISRKVGSVQISGR